METRCSKVIFPTIQKRNRLKIRSYRRYGEHGGKMFVFLGLFVHAAVRGGTCAFTLKFSTRWSKTAHATIGLRSRDRINPRPTFMSAPVFYTAAPKGVCIRRLAGARYVSPVVLWTLWPEGESEPLTSAPRSDFMTQSLVLPIDVCRGLGISPLRTNIWLNFSAADLGPTSAQELFFRVFLKVWNFFFGDLYS